MANTVYQLPEMMTKMAKEERLLFDRLFMVDAARTRMEIPPTMYAYCEKFFGSVEAVLKQRPVKVTNKITLDTAIFNALRLRPWKTLSRPSASSTPSPTRRKAPRPTISTGFTANSV